MVLAQRLSPYLEQVRPQGLLDTTAAAAHLKIHPKTLERAARAGRVVGARRVGGQWRFVAPDLKVLPAGSRGTVSRRPASATSNTDVAGAIRGRRRRS
ncbi:helix-turn-helix domain-containing protein [Conexibacter stalactiti]|uniref:helix-turn-helix domain-containing protein n=1 Tax=Conexibacter stalactiti TaxID=1940611 RepID=UPI00384CD857